MDKKLSKLIQNEVKRQALTLDLIPSENIASPELLHVLGSPLINKYAEGYPGGRYYPGNQYIDDIERLARERALKAFKLSSDQWAVNVQSYSGSPANQAVYLALARPGEKLMGLKLSHGGHLTHGHGVNFSGRTYHAIHYELGEGGRIDYDRLRLAAKQEKPRVLVSGATAYPRVIDFKKFGEIAKEVGAYHVADISHIAGLVAAKAHPSPFPYADVVTLTTHKTLRGPRGALIFSSKDNQSLPEAIDKAVFPGLQGGPHMNTIAGIAFALNEVATPKFRAYANGVIKNAQALADALLKHGFTLVSGGTDNHLILLDVRAIGFSGRDAEALLEKGGIIANRNTIPGDDKPFSPSGLRLGTPSLSSRGMGEKEMRAVADLIFRILITKEKPVSVRRDTERLAKKFALPYKSTW